MHQRLAFFERSTFAHENQALARRHDLAHGSIQPGLKTQVAVGHDAHHDFAAQHREARDTVLLAQRHHLAHCHVGRHGDRVAQQARFITLDPGDFSRLLLGREVFMHHTNAAFLCDGNGQSRFRHSVHGR